MSLIAVAMNALLAILLIVALGFALPPGSYATVVVKRLTYDFGHTFRA